MQHRRCLPKSNPKNFFRMACSLSLAGLTNINNTQSTSTTNDDVEETTESSERTRRKQLERIRRQREQERAAIIRKVKTILAKPSNVLTFAEQCMLQKHPNEVDEARHRLKLKAARTSRMAETFDTDEALKIKCRALCKLLRESKHTVVYVGAGISTTSNIPDYRSTSKGTYHKVKHVRQIDDVCKISLAHAPNLAHMALKAMTDVGIIQYIVSQNCDGLFLRAGVDTEQRMSEIHGNQFIECCAACSSSPAATELSALNQSSDCNKAAVTRYFYRTFDVTQKVSYRRHRTGRLCPYCSSPLIDTIVLSGEKPQIERPACWKRAAQHASQAQLIVCLGTSLNVLKHYECLWPASLESHATKLVVVNLQWTCKDTKADIKINACCSDVLRQVAHMLRLSVGEYKYPESDAVLLRHNQKQQQQQQLLSLPTNSCSSSSVAETVPRLNLPQDYSTLYVPGWLKASVKTSVNVNAKILASNNNSAGGSNCENGSNNKRKRKRRRYC